jgi:cell volume regulation protein A
MFIARPVAVVACALPFRFTWREIAFVSWVGLRGAVPIFLATVPVLAALPGGRNYFDIAFVVVLASLLLQGWTVPLVARTLGLDLPAAPEPAERSALEVPQTIDRDIAGFTVGARSTMTQHPYGELPLPNRSRILSVIREGTVLDRAQVERLQPGDYALTVAPADQMERLDRLFAARSEADEDPLGVFGEFTFDGATPAASLNQLYELALRNEEMSDTLADLVRRRLAHVPVVGDRVGAGSVELVVREMADGAVAKVGLEVAPSERPRRGLAALPDLIRRWRSARAS